MTMASDRAAHIVTVSFAPYWPEQVLDIPVACLVSRRDGVYRVDLATPQVHLGAWASRARARERFRVALQVAVAERLGHKVTAVPDDRVDWVGYVLGE